MIHTQISIVKAVSLAKVYEEKDSLQYKPKDQHQNHPHSYQVRIPNKTNISQKYNPPILSTPPTRPINPFQKNTNIKRMSQAELQLRRDKDLCYWCDEKFSFTHKFPNKHLMILQYDDEEHGQMEVDKDIAGDNLGESRSIEKDHNLSFNAMKGTNGMGTLKFHGQIGQVRVQILVDGGSSDNFLQSRITQVKSITNFWFRSIGGEWTVYDSRRTHTIANNQGSRTRVSGTSVPLTHSWCRSNFGHNLACHLGCSCS
ncbi:hypothetical protein TanjilG_06136 [Lupinus angustifolius]|uniref:Uncharacterized protein n=1 Tax=Lupinus angustifolius TaxID=3871 RepID=A0A394DE44_LUPAN|nr:hypothetical protein TanjilG_06136 [Lupinus angustifolius]